MQRALTLCSVPRARPGAEAMGPPSSTEPWLRGRHKSRLQGHVLGVRLRGSGGAGRRGRAGGHRWRQVASGVSAVRSGTYSGCAKGPAERQSQVAWWDQRGKGGAARAGAVPLSRRVPAAGVDGQEAQEVGRPHGGRRSEAALWVLAGLGAGWAPRHACPEEPGGCPGGTHRGAPMVEPSARPRGQGWKWRRGLGLRRPVSGHWG